MALCIPRFMTYKYGRKSDFHKIMETKHAKRFMFYGQVHLRSNVKQIFHWISVAEHRSCPVTFGDSLLYRTSVRHFVDIL